jgi:ABC-type sugar transport system ATPase subunit
VVVGRALDAEVKRAERPVRAGTPLVEVRGLQVGRRVPGASFAAREPGEVVDVAGLVPVAAARFSSRCSACAAFAVSYVGRATPFDHLKET